jgi:predicted nucleic acid-binding protein
MIVVDATVAAKWYLNEAGSQRALGLLASGEDLFAPDLINAEVTGAIVRRHRIGGITRVEAEALVLDWKRDFGKIEIEPWQDLLDDAVALALTISHSLLDCIYLACAKRLAAPLLTADEKLHRGGSLAYGAVMLL